MSENSDKDCSSNFLDMTKHPLYLVVSTLRVILRSTTT